MSFDTPWLYGAGLSSVLLNDNSIAPAVLGRSPDLIECLEAGVDVRVSTVLLDAFRNGPNCVNVERPRVGLCTREGSQMLEHDTLVIATGVRDFVPSLTGWELPGVFGGKAGIALLDLHPVFDYRKALVLRSSDLAMRFICSAMARGVEVGAVVEVEGHVVAGPEATNWLSKQATPVHLGCILQKAIGQTAFAGARCVSLDGQTTFVVECDSIAVAIATLPNIELPAAMDCKMRYDQSLLWPRDIHEVDKRVFLEGTQV